MNIGIIDMSKVIKNKSDSDSDSEQSADSNPKEKKNAEQKEQHKLYMRKYIQNAEDVYCSSCNVTYKKYRKYRHLQTKKHQANVKQLLDETDRETIQELQKRVTTLENKIKQKF